MGGFGGWFGGGWVVLGTCFGLDVGDAWRVCVTGAQLVAMHTHCVMLAFLFSISTRV